MVKPGGVLVVNSSMVDRDVNRSDITWISLPCNEIAEQAGNKRMANVVATGALLALVPVLTLDEVESALKAHMPGRHKDLLSKNVEALKRGAEYALEHTHKAK